MSETILVSQFVTGVKDFAGAIGTSAATADAGPAIGLVWSKCASAAETAICGALDVDLVSLLADGWSKAKELRGYADPEKYPKSKTVQMALLEHTIVSTINPELTPIIDGMPLPKLDLSIELTTKIESAILVINSAQILKVKLGKVSISGELKWKETPLPFDFRSCELELPASHAFKPPIQIKKLDPATAKPTATSAAVPGAYP